MGDKRVASSSEKEAAAGPESLDRRTDESSSTTVEDAIVEVPISTLLDEDVESDEVADKVRRIDVRGGLNRERVDAYKLALKWGAKLGEM